MLQRDFECLSFSFAKGTLSKGTWDFSPVFLIHTHSGINSVLNNKYIFLDFARPKLKEKSFHILQVIFTLN